MSNPYAIVAITKHGVELARKLHQELPGSDLFYMSKFAQGDEEAKGIRLFEGSVKLILPDLFQTYTGIIQFISLGAVVRMIAPILQDKKTDPGVVVVDDRGEFAISVLSGHLGGANELTRMVAERIHATPVITTASDVQKTIPVDLFGAQFGWKIESFERATPVSAAVVNEEPVIIVQESGETDWWKYDKPLPSHFKVTQDIQEAIRTAHEWKAALVVTHRLLSPIETEVLLKNGVLYRPQNLVIGIGCNRGTSQEEIESVVHTAFEELGLSMRSVRRVASIDLKADEAGLLGFCQMHKFQFVTYTAEELNEISIAQPSDTVFKFTGAYGVSEPAARLASGAASCLLEKRKSGNVTLSIALIPSGGSQ